MNPLILWKDLVCLFYPRLCPGCGLSLQHHEKMLCVFCLSRLPRFNAQSLKSNQVADLFRGRIALHGAHSFLFFRKRGMTQKFMHEIKYKGNTDLGKYLGALYGLDLKAMTAFEAPDLLIPVPLHPLKLKIRGYNQTVAIAEGLSETWQLPSCPHLLSKKINTTSQTRLKRFARWENTAEAFLVHDSDQIKGKHVALIDDVITTGATLEACSTLLLENGAAAVSVFSLCLAIN